MRTMRLMLRDGQSGGHLAVLLVLCFLFQAFAALPAMARTPDPGVLVLCNPLPGGRHHDAGDGKSVPAQHDCCPGLCLAGAVAPPPAAPDLGPAFAGTVLVAPDASGVPPWQRVGRGPAQPRAPPASS